MGTWSIWHWLVVLLIVLLVFGTKKLRNIGADLGGAVRGFKDGMKSSEDKPGEGGAAAPGCAHAGPFVRPAAALRQRRQGRHQPRDRVGGAAQVKEHRGGCRAGIRERRPERDDENRRRAELPCANRGPGRRAPCRRCAPHLRSPRELSAFGRGRRRAARRRTFAENPRLIPALDCG